MLEIPAPGAAVLPSLE